MIDFQQVADCLSEIQQNGSTLVKEALLKKYGASVDGFKEVLKFIYDPYFVTGLKTARLYSTEVYLYADEISVEEIMQYLRKYNTGTYDDVRMAVSFIDQSDDPNWQWAAEGLVTKDLQIGVSVTTLNKVFGSSFIPKIGIMRGMLCPDDAAGTYIVTEKIDGNRRLIMNKETGVEIYTRSGKRDAGLVEIEKEVAEYLPKGFVYDCECVAEGSYGDNIELRQASASLLNRRNQVRTGVHALCFDMIKQEDYDAGISKMNALGRKTMAAAAFDDTQSFVALMTAAYAYDDEHHTNMANSVNALYNGYRGRGAACKHISVLPILGIAHNKAEGIEIAKPIWDVNGEGVMLVEIRSPYEVNPNPRKTLLKIKMLKEYVCTCTGVFEGDNKYTGMAGGIYVQWVDANKQTWEFKVGTGFTDADRQLLWNKPWLISGKKVEIESFGESTNAQGGRALNCPVFKRIVGQEE